MPFSSLAVTASDSNASRVWEDFSNNLDDISDDIALASEDDIALASEDDIALSASLQSLDLHAVLSSISTGQFYQSPSPYKVALDSSGKYYAYYFDKAPDGYYYSGLYVRLVKSALPSSGTYGFNSYFIEGNIDLSPTYAQIHIQSKSNNVKEVSTWAKCSLSADSAAIHHLSANITVPSNVSAITYYMNWPEKMTGKFDVLTPTSDPYVFTFSKVSGAASVVPSADSMPSTDDVIAGNSSTIAENSSRQVEQGDSIIELIKNTIQTISSQLTAFWNQLAGEFTNLYNKMNQQHADKMQSDQDTRDTITEESEKSRNFIVDGIINGLKSLFIPSDDYFKAWFDDIYAFFNDRFGFLMFPIDILVKMVNLYVNADSSFAGVPFPEFKWIDGSVVIPAQTVQFTYLETDWGQGIQQKLYFVGDVIMIGALFSLIHRKFEEVLKN